MSIQRINPDDIENFTIETNPLRTYVSSSSGVTGSVYLFARRSLIQKDPYSNTRFTVGPYTDSNLESARLNTLRLTTNNIAGNIIGYMSGVQELQTSGRQYQKLEIKRFVPPYFNDTPFPGSVNKFNVTPKTISGSFKKEIILNNLFPYYRTVDPNSHFAISNFHSLNFFTSSATPDQSVLLYPNPLNEDSDNKESLFGFNNSFTFDFWIKPTQINNPYKAGAIFHLTGAYCISLHTGSSRDLNGNIDAYKLVLQLTESANISPSLITAGNYIFSSSNNALKRNEWNHITIRWGGPTYNNGTGSFIINNKVDSYFTINNSLLIGDYQYGSPSALCIGNYYEGTNNNINNLKLFFTNKTHGFEGLYELDPGSQFAPTNYNFSHPLNAEIQELKIYNKYLDTDQINYLNSFGPKTSDTGLIFYLPPFFTEESPVRQNIPYAPGVATFSKGTTTTTYNVSMSYAVNGMYTNLENYTREFIHGLYPRLWNLTSSFPQLSDNENQLSANNTLYNTGSLKKRLYTVLPSDNGKIFPNYDYLSPLSQSMFKNDLNADSIGFVTLNNQIKKINDQILDRTVTTDYGISPELPNGFRGSISNFLTKNLCSVLDRMKDNSSNQIVIFDISNIFYGKQIKPKTFTIVDTNMSGSDGTQKITIKDNGLGSLYRADSNGPHAEWSTIGNIFYNEGIVIIKHPQLSFFGANEYELSFQGTQDIHTLTINTFARPMQQVSSSNTSFTSKSIDNLANNTDERYVYITGINIHDDNLNVIARTNIAQPIVKYSSDKILFKFKMDF